MGKVIAFKKTDIKRYLDGAIKSWRKERDRQKGKNRLLAVHYIDAYQSVRMSIFGELLPCKK